MTGWASMCSRPAWISSIHASTATTTARRSTSSGSTARSPSGRRIRPDCQPEVSGTEFALFVQDRWRVNDRLSFELGMRVDFDDIVEGVNYSPRAACRQPASRGRGILRGVLANSPSAPADDRRLHAMRRADGQPVCCRRHRSAPQSPSFTCSTASSRRRRASSRPSPGTSDSAALLLQGRLPPPRRITCVRSIRTPAAACLRSAPSASQMLGARDDGAVSRQRIPRPERV